MPLTIGIISIRGDDYPPTRRFIQAGAAMGHRVTVIHPYRTWPAVGGDIPGLLPDGAPAFDAVMPRQGAEVGDGCLPLVRHFMDAGTVVINGLDAIMTCRNPFLILQRLVHAGVPVPPTVFINDIAGLEGACDRLAGELVVVKAVGSRQGRGVIRMDRRAPEADRVSAILAQGRGALVQAYIAPEGRRDVRVLVVGGRAVAAMALTPLAGDFRANYHITGTAAPVTLDAELSDPAVAAAAAVGLEVAGVDLVIPPGGRPTVLEVNYSPGFQGLEKATGCDIAREILSYVVATVAAGASAGHRPHGR